MDRNIWLQYITNRGCPSWPCHICGKGTLLLVPGALVKTETVESAQARMEMDWEPEWISFAFTAWAQCTHPSCKQEFAIAGSGRVISRDHEECEDGEDWEEVFYPKFCFPMPELISLPPNCPGDVIEELQNAFALFWSSTAACAGRIRVAIEFLLNHLDVPKQMKGKNGKFFTLNLHARIDEYSKNSSTIGSHLMALKWLGNTGSHDSALEARDLLDAFEILENSLAEIFDRRSARVAEMAQNLTRKHAKK